MSSGRPQVRNAGVVKVNFGATSGNPWTFSLAAGVSIQLTPPTPLVYSSSTLWPETQPNQSDDDILVVTVPEGTRWREPNVDRQVHSWRVFVTYLRSDASTDEQFQLRMVNPHSSFDAHASFQLLRGNVTDRDSVAYTIVGDSYSIPEAPGPGAGYQMWAKSTTALEVEITSVLRSSSFHDNPRNF